MRVKNPSKLDRLREILSGYGSVLVAFSGGVDSAFVLKLARETLGRELAKAVTAESESVPARGLEHARSLAREPDVEHRVIRTREFGRAAYRSNSEHRCYFCKTELYDQLIPIAREWNLKAIVNGTQMDDLGDFRPGLLAASEHGVKSPLVEARFGKDEIREHSLKIGLSVWDKPAAPCLSSRVPYGEEITLEKLKQIETGENFLKDLGFKELRLRHFGHRARIELGRDEFVRLMDAGLRVQITEFVRALGFKVVQFDRYASGRLNQEAGLKGVS